MGGAKPFLGCAGIIIVLTVTASYLFISSLNPLDVYVSNNTVAKIIVSLLCAILVMVVFQFINKLLIMATIRMSTGRPAENARCAGCGFPLLQYVGSHGMPMRCGGCGELSRLSGRRHSPRSRAVDDSGPVRGRRQGPTHA